MLAALAIAVSWIVWREPSYLPPPGDEIDILLELAGVFPDNYGIMWREHQLLRATDPEAQQYPSLLDDALFMHKLLTTEGGQSNGDISVEVGYRFYAGDHRSHPDPAMRSDVGSSLGKLAADPAHFNCACDTLDAHSTSCRGVLVFGNYEFSLAASYNRQQCTDPIDPKRRDEFRRSMQTADRLIALYLNPLRRKPGWL